MFSLLQSIRHLRNSFPLSVTQIFLVDNSEHPDWGLELFDESAVDQRELKVELRLSRGNGNVGFGRGHNLVINELESTYHLILNPDVTLDEDCLAEGIKYLDLHPQTSIASPHATGFDGKQQHLCKTFPAIFTFLVRGFCPAPWQELFVKRLAKYELHKLSEIEPGTGIPIVSGCFMLCRTELLQKVQGFDENYFLYFEDFDLSLRIGKIADIVYLPSMRIVHAGGHAARKGIRHLLMFVKSAWYFYNTHGWRVFKQV